MVRDVPKEVNGWIAASEVDTYDRKTLFDYIDGGAELYLAYRFNKVEVYTYKKGGGPDIIMDIYDMGTPEDAFGVFTAEREGDDVGIGQGSEYAAGLLRFFKERFFISIVTYEETSQSKKAVFWLARAISDAIRSSGGRPKILSYLPPKGLIERSIRFFHSHIILNHYYYIADENILKLDMNTEAVLARYALDGEKLYLLIVRYPTTEHAKVADGNFLNAYMPDALQKGIVRTEDGKWTATMLQDKVLTMVFDAPNPNSANSLLEAVRMQLEAKP